MDTNRLDELYDNSLEVLEATEPGENTAARVGKLFCGIIEETKTGLVNLSDRCAAALKEALEAKSSATGANTTAFKAQADADAAQAAISAHLEEFAALQARAATAVVPFNGIHRSLPLGGTRGFVRANGVQKAYFGGSVPAGFTEEDYTQEVVNDSGSLNVSTKEIRADQIFKDTTTGRLYRYNKDADNLMAYADFADFAELSQRVAELEQIIAQTTATE